MTRTTVTVCRARSTSEHSLPNSFGNIARVVRVFGRIYIECSENIVGDSSPKRPSDRVKDRERERTRIRPEYLAASVSSRSDSSSLSPACQPVTSESGVHDGENGQKGTSNEDRQRRDTQQRARGRK